MIRNSIKLKARFNSLLGSLVPFLVNELTLCGNISLKWICVCSLIQLKLSNIQSKTLNISCKLQLSCHRWRPRPFPFVNERIYEHYSTRDQEEPATINVTKYLFQFPLLTVFHIFLPYPVIIQWIKWIIEVDLVVSSTKFTNQS